MPDATFSLRYIGRLHRLPGVAPAAGSSANASAGNQSGNSGGKDRLDNDPIPTMTLHLHSIAAADPGTVVVVQKLQVRLRKFVWKKKIKKDLTSRITWDIKGVLTRKTKG